MAGQAALLPAFYEAPPEDYVVADHPFTSDPSRAQANVYLSFEAGDKIRIYNRDPASGWWDGELVVAGGQPVAEHARKRGWLPSNHVSPIDPSEVYLAASTPDFTALRRPSAASISSADSYSASSGSGRQEHHAQHRSSASSNNASASRLEAIRRESDESGSSASQAYADWADGEDGLYDLETQVEQVLEPINQAIALVRAAILAKRQAHFQPSTACVISSIRSLLAATDCLSRDSLILKEFPPLAKIRKTILANLAELVALARSASSPYIEGNNADDDEIKEMEMEGMLKAGQDTLANVRTFLTTLAVHGIPLPESKDGEFPSIDGRHRPTQSSSTTTSRHTYGSSADSSRSHMRVDSDLPRRERKSSTQSNGSQGSQSGHLHEGFSRAAGSRNSGGREQVLAPQVKISRPPFAQAYDSSTNYTSSPVEVGMVPLQGNNRVDVLDWIAVIQDQLLSAVAALIGHTHTHSTSSHPSVHAYLIDITRETIDRIRELLVVVEAVEQHRQIRAIWPRESAQLRQSKTDMYDVTSRLIETAKKAASVALNTVTDAEDDGKVDLLQAATAVHRQSAVCIRLVQHCATRKGHPTKSFQIELDPRPSEGDSGLAPDQTDRSQQQFLRTQTVGQRGVHTLSSLGRQVIDLSSLQDRIVRDGSGTDPSGSETGDTADEQEYHEQDGGVGEQEDEHTMQASRFTATVRSPIQSTYEAGNSDHRFLSPIAPTYDATPASPGHRSRSASFSSPAGTPRLLQHRSPSKSADLNVLGGDLAFLKTPRQDDRGFSKHRSLDVDTLMSTPRPHHSAQSDRRGDRFADADQEMSDHLQAVKIASQPRDPAMDLSSRTRAVPQHDNRSESAPPADTSTPMSSHYNAADMRLWLESHDYSPRDVTYNAEGQITGASLDVLVEKLTPHDTMVDADLMETFFLTFRLFATPARLLETLELRYDLSPPARMPLIPETIRIWNERKVTPVRLRIFKLLKTWLEAYWNEETDSGTLDNIGMFISERLSRAFPSESPRLLALVESYRAGDTPRLVNRAFSRIRSTDRFQAGSPTSPLYAAGFFNATAMTGLPPTPIMGKQLFNNLRNGNAGIVITDFNALELARQLTLMESKLYCAITADDLLQTGRKKIASLRAMSTLSNRITGWVADSILDEQDTKRRTSLLKFFIKLSNQCLELNNFSTLFALLAGLNSSTITRLRRTWEGLSSKYRNIIEDLRRVIEHTRNHANYRARLRSVEGPALPFLGLILTDITFTSDGNPSHRPSALDADVKLINFDKYARLARIVAEFRRYQAPYNLAVLPDVQNFLERILAERGSTSLDDLHRKSLFLEPRQGTEATGAAASLDKPTWLTGRL